LAEKQEEIIIQNPFGFEKLINSWKEYPIEQWLREQEIGRIQQANFKPPEFHDQINPQTGKKCGGRWVKLETSEGIQYVCDNCKAIAPYASHTVFYTNYQFIAQPV
jgi:hypothetical protein